MHEPVNPLAAPLPLTVLDANVRSHPPEVDSERQPGGSAPRP
jgi:hypothetical protein